MRMERKEKKKEKWKERMKGNKFKKVRKERV